MNPWLLAALAIVAALVPAGVMVLRGGEMERLVALEVGAALETLVLMLLAEGFRRLPFFDLALALALLSFAGGLVFARFLERWL